MLLLFSYLQTFERLEGAALALSIGFSAALALQDAYAADFASFVNSNLSEIIGALIAAAMLLIFRTIDPVWNARRILKTGRTALSDLARRQPDDIKAWIMQMFDRVGLAATRLDNSASGAAQRICFAICGSGWASPHWIAAGALWSYHGARISELARSS